MISLMFNKISIFYFGKIKREELKICKRCIYILTIIIDDDSILLHYMSNVVINKGAKL